MFGFVFPVVAWLASRVPRFPSRALLLVSILGFGSVVGCGGEQAPPQSAETQPAVDSPPLALPKLAAVRGAPKDALVFEGEVESTLFTELGFAVAGRVEFVRVAEGDRVRKGTILASLDRLDRLEQLDAIRRRLAEARTAAGRGAGARASAGQIPAYRRAEIQRRLRAAEADQADLAATKRALATEGRIDGLAGMNRVLANRAYRVGKKAQYRSRAVDERTADERLAVALADSLQQREKRLERELTECDILSPIDGIVVMVRTREGQSVQTRGADAAFVLIDPADQVVRMAVPEKLAKILGPGEDAWLEFDAVGVSGTASVLWVDATPYPAAWIAGGSAVDVLVAPQPGLLTDLRIGGLGRVALRR